MIIVLVYCGTQACITLPTGDSARGLGAGRGTASVNLLGQYTHDQGTWLLNAGMTHNANRAGQRKSLWNLSAAALYSPNTQWTLAADVGIGRDPDPAGTRHPAYALLGAIYHINKDMDVDAGYRRSLQGGPVEQTLGVGLTVRWP